MGSEPRGVAMECLAEILATLIESDKAAATVRPDLTVADVYLIVGALSATIRSESGDWRRLLTLLYDGFATVGFRTESCRVEQTP
ncbi:SbtR family transcriptional regulator [Nocardia tengchongensis]|uniref:SbtR family transcriptional regulator n=1 Tax=Nocardia tengchongensis TaxID=2055889 RepID=UPI0036BEF8D6